MNVTLAADVLNLPENIELINGMIVGIYFKDTIHKKKFIDIFKGENAKKLLLTLQKETKKYNQGIEYVDENILESTLTVNEYLKFYGMIKNLYDGDYPDRVAHLLNKINLFEQREISMMQLKSSQQKSVRVLASCLNNLILFVGNNLLDDMDQTEKGRLYDVLSYCLKNMAICIVLEDTKENLENFADVIYEV